MGSTRLPGKILAEVNGLPLLSIILTRLQALNECRVVVATTTDARDSVVVDHCRVMGVEAIRGNESDVLSRYVLALETFGGDPVVRLTADCPLSDPQVIRQALDAHRSTHAAFTSNTLVRTFPVGLDVEVISADALHEASAEAVDPIEREHVTPFIYRRPERFQLRTLRTSPFAGNERWTVDYPSDLRVIGDALSRVRDWKTAGWAEILAAVGRRAASTAADTLTLRPAESADRDLLLAWRNDAATIHFSASGRSVEPAEHEAWFTRVLECPATRIWIGSIGETRVGQIRIDVRGGVAEVSVGVSATMRGQGHGSRMIAALLEAASSGDRQVISYIARVHRDNIASLHAFSACGFASREAEGDFLILERPR